MYSRTASKRYAKALIESAAESNLLEETYSEINSFKDILKNSRQLSDYLLNPTISKEDKGNLIIKILGDEYPNPVSYTHLTLPTILLV